MDEEHLTNEKQEIPVEKNQRFTGLIIAGIVLVVLLILVGLFLPPISLGARLGITDEAETGDIQAQAGSEDQLNLSDEFTLSLAGTPTDVEAGTIAQSDFLSGDAGEEWVSAAETIPSSLTLVSDVYTVDYEVDEAGSAPVGTAEIVISEQAQPYQTLDLYSWDGQNWDFMPSQVSEDGSLLTSAERPLPNALALMQTSKPAEPEIGAEVLPAQELPSAVLPYLTEVSAGTLTLAEGGRLLGEVVSVPAGGYQQYLRATNTGAILDTVSLSNLLADPSAQERNIQELVDGAQSGDFVGVNLDYQGVYPVQKGAFTAFVSKLAETLHEQDLNLIITLETPFLNEGLFDTAGQDWQAIGQTADVVYLQMPLDPTRYDDDGEAQQIVEWATRQVDRYKLAPMLTVNSIDAVGETKREVAGDKALENFGELELVRGSTEVEPSEEIEVALSGSASDLEWDPESLTYRYTYEQSDQPHEVWLGSEAVLSHQGRLQNRYNVRGLAVRGLSHLEQADGYAAAINSYLGEGEAPQPASAAIVWVVEDDSGSVMASSSGEDLSFQWDGSDKPGNYVLRAEFAHGDNVASLGSLELSVNQVEPTPTPEPEEEAVVEAEPTATAPAVAGSQAADIDPGDADAVVKTPANFRKGPGVGYGIISGLDPGTKVSLTGRNDDAAWFQVQTSDGTEGWIFADLLTINSNLDVNLLAVIEVEPPTTVAGGGAAPAPVLAPAGGGSFELGGQTHSLANPQLMKMAGMNWVKFQHKWGPGDAPDSVAGRIGQAHSNGFKVLLSIPGSDSYPSNIDFNSYVQFLGGVAALGPDAIEIWNEENIDFEWPAGQIDPTSYVNNMLAPAYNAIKSANPNVMVIMGAPAPTGFDNGTNAWSDARYMAGVAAAGGASYMDCIGVHHNAGATPPSAVSGHPAGGSHYSWYLLPTLNMYYNSFGGSRPVCFTELGYLSGEDFGGVPSRFSWAANTTVGQHAQWLAEAASLSANSGKVRLAIVFNVDFTTWGADPQAGYAMLRPDGSCPSCSLLGQVMGG